MAVSLGPWFLCVNEADVGDGECGDQEVGKDMVFPVVMYGCDLDCEES